MLTTIRKHSIFKNIPQLTSTQLIFVLLPILLLVRIPILTEPLWHDDEAITLTVGQAINSHHILYQDIHDNKPPLLYVFASLTPDYFTFKLIFNCIVLLATLIFIYLTNLIYKQTFPSAIFSIGVFILYTTIPYIEPNVVNGEIVHLLPTITAILLLYIHHFKQKPRLLFLTGVSLGIASLVKQPALLDLITVTFFLYTFKSNLSSFFLQAIQMGIGFSIPHVITISYFALNQALIPYIRSVWFQNILYLSSNRSGLPVSQSTAFDFTLLIKTGVLVFILVFLYRYKSSLKQTSFLILTWLSVSLFAALLSGRPYPHYYLQLLPSLSLSLPLLFNHHRLTQILSLTLLILTVLGWKYYQFDPYPVLPYYQNFYHHYLIKHRPHEYRHYYDPHVNNLYSLSSYIKQHPKLQPYYYWGNKPSINYLTNQTPYTKYITAYHVRDFLALPNTIADLEANPPTTIIYQHSLPQSFPALDTFLNQRYQPYLDYPMLTIYKLNGTPNVKKL